MELVLVSILVGFLLSVLLVYLSQLWLIAYAQAPVTTVAITILTPIMALILYNADKIVKVIGN